MIEVTKQQLTSAEISALWSQYINDSVTECVLNYFLKNTEEEKVGLTIKSGLEAATGNLEKLKRIFDEEGFAYPYGFSEADVKADSPKLFSDTFTLLYIRHMSMLGMAASSGAIALASRPDIITFHKEVLESAIALDDAARIRLLEQGSYIRPPNIPIPKKTEFVEQQRFLAGFLKNNKRPLTAMEITHLFMNIQTNQIGKALIIGFMQISDHPEVKEFLKRGKEIAQKHIDLFSDTLKHSDVPAPASWDAEVTDSTVKVFSDRLIMFHISAMISAGIGNYGMAISASLRKDIGAQYLSLLPEIALYAEDGMNIMIKHGWLEEPPMAADRSLLSKA